jgi:hypothetical protein
LERLEDRFALATGVLTYGGGISLVVVIGAVVWLITQFTTAQATLNSAKNQAEEITNKLVEARQRQDQLMGEVTRVQAPLANSVQEAISREISRPDGAFQRALDRSAQVLLLKAGARCPQGTRQFTTLVFMLKEDIARLGNYPSDVTALAPTARWGYATVELCMPGA